MSVPGSVGDDATIVETFNENVTTDPSILAAISAASNAWAVAGETAWTAGEADEWGGVAIASRNNARTQVAIDFVEQVTEFGSSLGLEAGSPMLERAIAVVLQTYASEGQEAALALVENLTDPETSPLARFLGSEGTGAGEYSEGAIELTAEVLDIADRLGFSEERTDQLVSSTLKILQTLGFDAASVYVSALDRAIPVLPTYAGQPAKEPNDPTR